VPVRLVTCPADPSRSGAERCTGGILARRTTSLKEGDRSMPRFDSVPESIRREIERRIVEGRLKPGEKLGLKRDLQNEFQVAGPTIDQALRLLVNDGLVALRRGPGGGVFVDRSRPVLRLGTKLTWARDTTMYAENREIREALLSVLGAAAARAARRDVRLVSDLAAIADAIAESPVEAFETHQLIWKGQQLLLELSDNGTLSAIYDDLLATLLDVVVTIEPPTTQAEITREQRRIEAHVSMFRSVVDGDVEAAREFGRLLPVLGEPAITRVPDADEN
jgi:DNA-binding FadR family transcriptional regulator